MRAIIIFLLFVVSAFLIGAVLAYPLKLLLDPIFGLAYRKYLTYATLGSGLIVSGIYLYIYNLLSFKSFGYTGSKRAFLKTLGNGFLFGMLIMLIIETILLLLGIHEFDETRQVTITVITTVLIKGIILGLIISVIEESIFRGALFSGLLKQTNAVITVIFSSLVYSAVHFIRYRDLPPNAEISWLTGFELMPEAFRRFYHWSIEDYFLTLFIFGVLLSLLRLKHGSLAACIGVHAGVVMFIKVSSYFTNRTHNSNYEFLVSQYNSTFGWMSFFVILLFSIYYLIKVISKK